MTCSFARVRTLLSMGCTIGKPILQPPALVWVLLRTLDPNEADYFYVPVHVSCLADVIGKADKPIFPDDVPGVGMWRE
eukprot:scaffold94660_cov15-Tisochrysis_lutea.AAC.1